jgi:hypothetical protein
LAAVNLASLELKEQSVLTTDFPFFSMMSIYFAIAKVYPALKKACADGAKISGTTVEIYDKPQNKIVYYALKRDD